MVKVELYGGAMEVDLPPEFVDLSTVRDVPDHQEVYVCKESARSIMFEIYGHEESVSDEESVKHYFFDLAKANGDENPEFLNAKTLSSSDLPKFSCEKSWSVHIGSGMQHAAKFKETAKNEVGIHLIVIRVADLDFNFLISLNSPKNLHPDSEEKSDRIYSWEEDEVVIANILKSFKINDWSFLG